MHVIIHCGLDKAGSTAIQAHVALFRPWLLRNGVYLPGTGLSGFGHVAVFRDLGIDNWQPLLDELDSAREQGFMQCFLSHEGVCRFDEQSLRRIRSYLGSYEVKVLFYLREQAEILQSGYLQGLKSARSSVSIAQLNADHTLLDAPERDYLLMLGKFEAVFGKEAIVLRPYQVANWRDGSIVWDLLAVLGCPPDCGIMPSEQRQNGSLDAQAAGILNVFDSYGDDTAGREALVEDLLWLIQRNPGGDRYFLQPAAVQHIRSTYRSSNDALAQRYGIEFDYRDCVARPADGELKSSDYMGELAELSRYFRWRGDLLQGPELEPLLRYSSGWSHIESWGVWSVGDISQLDFRLPMPRFTGFEDVFILEFQGDYFADNTSTQIWMNNTLIGDFDLREVAIGIPLPLLDESRVAHLELRHHAAISPQALAMGSDGRRLAYGLKSLGYRLAKA